MTAVPHPPAIMSGHPPTIAHRLFCDHECCPGIDTVARLNAQRGDPDALAVQLARALDLLEAACPDLHRLSVADSHSTAAMTRAKALDLLSELRRWRGRS